MGKLKLKLPTKDRRRKRGNCVKCGGKVTKKVFGGTASDEIHRPTEIWLLCFECGHEEMEE